VGPGVFTWNDYKLELNYLIIKYFENLKGLNPKIGNHENQTICALHAVFRNSMAMQKRGSANSINIRSSGNS